LLSGVENSQAFEVLEAGFWFLCSDVYGKSSALRIPYLRKKLPWPHPIKQTSVFLHINNWEIPQAST
jgi:hypothetical protein